MVLEMEEWIGSWYILEAELTRTATELDVAQETNQG